jgi:hypothetical protein
LFEPGSDGLAGGRLGGFVEGTVDLAEGPGFAVSMEGEGGAFGSEDAVDIGRTLLDLRDIGSDAVVHLAAFLKEFDGAGEGQDVAGSGDGG